MRIKKINIIATSVILVSRMMCFSLNAEERSQKGLEIIPDTVAAAVNKTTALLAGDLEITMSSQADGAKNKRNYTTNALGQKVPRSTIIKSGKKAEQ